MKVLSVLFRDLSSPIFGKDQTDRHIMIFRNLDSDLGKSINFATCCQTINLDDTLAYTFIHAVAAAQTSTICSASEVSVNGETSHTCPVK
jgi:hypothetical protein